MLYKNSGFRSLYRHFAAFMLNDVLREKIGNFPNAEKANCVLTYGYIDHEKGLMLELIAAGIKEQADFTFFGTYYRGRVFVPIGEIIEAEYFPTDSSEEELRKSYADKLNILEMYNVSDEIRASRDMEFLDGSRHDEYPDDVVVYLKKQGVETETCWVRITGIGDRFFMGELFNEPERDFGFHSGDRIAFIAEEQEDGGIRLSADLTPDRILKTEELADGKLLKEAVAEFVKAQTKENFIEVLQLLRDSHVWVPCTAAVSESDMAELEKVMEEAGDVSEMIGKTFKTKDEVRMIPEILQNGENYFFPVFSSADEMGEFGERFSKLERHILEVIPMTLRNEKPIAGIVLNAFSEPFVLEARLFPMVQKMRSRIVDND